jgi:hypothetical protein
MYRLRLTSADIRKRAEHIEQNANMVRHEVETIRAMLDGLPPASPGYQPNHIHRTLDRERTTISQWEHIVCSFAEELRVVAMRMESVESD